MNCIGFEVSVTVVGGFVVSGMVSSVAVVVWAVVVGGEPHGPEDGWTNTESHDNHMMIV